MIPDNYKELSTEKLKMYLTSLEKSFRDYRPFGANGTMLMIDVIHAKRQLHKEIDKRK